MSDVVMGPLNDLIAEARATRRWLWCCYQDLWFTPDQLEAANAEGRFRWGAVNWKLCDPRERLAKAEADAVAARERADRIAREIDEWEWRD